MTTIEVIVKLVVELKQNIKYIIWYWDLRILYWNFKTKQNRVKKWIGRGFTQLMHKFFVNLPF